MPLDAPTGRDARFADPLQPLVLCSPFVVNAPSDLPRTQRKEVPQLLLDV
jgi:hypothetical protein